MSTNIRNNLLKIMEEYLTAKREAFKDHPLAVFVRQEVSKEFKQLPFIDSSKHMVIASVGQGNWAYVPWIAILNKQITSSTQRGYYIVYLFSEDMTKVYLTIAQGVTETSKDDMLTRKEQIPATIPDDSKVIKDGDIELGTSPMAKEYAFSTAAYIRYDFAHMPEESVLVSDLENMISIYENFIELNQLRVNKNYQYKERIIEDQPTYEGSNQNLIEHIYQYILSKGFIFTRDEVTNLFLSLRTKPFVILSGVSGTGKTMIARLFAESLGANEDNGQFAMISVRPDWSDASDLLGYIDIKGDFQEGPLTSVIRRATQDPYKPYIVLLDEMNLARVEYYFSDILSVMENRQWRNGRIESSHLLTKEEAGFDVHIPENLYVIGTVNMDETTHPFSKKVLDRANTIEFNRVDLTNLAFLQDIEEVDPIHVGYKNLAPSFLHLKDVFHTHENLVKQVSEELTEINKSLEEIHAHVGYRVRDEICFYLAYNLEATHFTFEQSFDYCILQKILPRVSGSDSRVEQILRDLYQYFTNKAYDEAMDDYSSDLATAKYPHSAEKVLEMLRRLEDDGFTSFWVT